MKIIFKEIPHIKSYLNKKKESTEYKARVRSLSVSRLYQSIMYRSLALKKVTKEKYINNNNLIIKNKVAMNNYYYLIKTTQIPSN